MTDPTHMGLRTLVQWDAETHLNGGNFWLGQVRALLADYDRLVATVAQKNTEIMDLVAYAERARAIADDSTNAI